MPLPPCKWMAHTLSIYCSLQCVDFNTSLSFVILYMKYRHFWFLSSCRFSAKAESAATLNSATWLPKHVTNNNKKSCLSRSSKVISSFLIWLLILSFSRFFSPLYLLSDFPNVDAGLNKVKSIYSVEPIYTYIYTTITHRIILTLVSHCIIQCF